MTIRRSKRASVKVPTEHEIQAAFFDWLGKQHPNVLAYAVPNAARRSYATARYLQKEGLKSGVPDVCICKAVEPFHGMYLEFKREKGGKLSDNQHHWLQQLCEEGYACGVVSGLDAAIEAARIYLGGGWYEFISEQQRRIAHRISTDTQH